MRDTIPKELLVFVGENDAELNEDINHGIFLTFILNKREASKAVIKNRINKLVYSYGDYVGDIKVVTLRNSGFTLELPEVDAMRIANFDSIPVIIHHPDLEEYKNYKLAIRVSRYWFLELLLKVRTINAGKLSGNFLVEFKYGDNSINFLSELDVLEDDSVKNSIKIGKLLADSSQWTDKLTPGRWYILKDRNKWLCRSIYLGEYSCIVNQKLWGPDKRSSLLDHDDLVRETYHIFKDAPYLDEGEELDQLIFPDLIKTIDFGYWNSRTTDEMKKYPGIEMGEVITAKGLLSEIIENEKDKFWDACMEEISEFVCIVPPEEIRKRKDKLINLLKEDCKRGKLGENSNNDKFISARLTDLFGFSDIEVNEIINELWK